MQSFFIHNNRDSHLKIRFPHITIRYKNRMIKKFFPVTCYHHPHETGKNIIGLIKNL